VHGNATNMLSAGNLDRLNHANNLKEDIQAQLSKALMQQESGRNSAQVEQKVEQKRGSTYGDDNAGFTRAQGFVPLGGIFGGQDVSLHLA